MHQHRSSMSRRCKGSRRSRVPLGHCILVWLMHSACVRIAVNGTCAQCAANNKLMMHAHTGLEVLGSSVTVHTPGVLGYVRGASIVGWQSPTCLLMQHRGDGAHRCEGHPAAGGGGPSAPAQQRQRRAAAGAVCDRQRRLHHGARRVGAQARSPTSDPCSTASARTHGGCSR